MILLQETKVTGIRPMTDADRPQAFRLLSEYLTKFALAPVYTAEEFQHWFTPRVDVIDSYVVEVGSHVLSAVSIDGHWEVWADSPHSGSSRPPSGCFQRQPVSSASS